MQDLSIGVVFTQLSLAVVTPQGCGFTN
jgi:hypothetical protein